MLSKTEKVIQEMLVPTGGFDSRLEWLAFWLDEADALIEKATGEPQGHVVQDDLRRWAETLRSE